MRVCAGCFDDPGIRSWIRDQGGRRGCEYCAGHDSPTTDVQELADYMRECLERFYSYAEDNLPYESAEGGWQGPHWDTWNLLIEQLGFGFSRRGANQLMGDLFPAISENTWCEFDWLSLEFDDSLKLSWRNFCDVVKHQLRFFFHQIKDDDDRDAISPGTLLGQIASLVDDLGIIKTLPVGKRLYRARLNLSGKINLEDFGPPPIERALQSNRMNPPGIPALYVTERKRTAILEVRAKCARVGVMRLTRPIRIIDLAELPDLPSIFSGVSQRERLGLSFLHHFQEEIVQPIARDDRIHVDYIPPQIVSEFFKLHSFAGGPVDGVRYRSAVDPRGYNLVLFVPISHPDNEEAQCYEILSAAKFCV